MRYENKKSYCFLQLFFRVFRDFRGLCFSTVFDYQGHFLLEITLGD